MQFLYFIVGLSLLVFIVSSEDRVMGWNKAHGLWGKRSDDSAMSSKRTPQNWNKLNSLWGKRSGFESTDSQEGSDENEYVALKRSSAQWQRANGLWGR